jgi:hypothetical protein
MADDTNTPPFADPGRREFPERGGRPGPNREPGGFRIRLSDNEMQAARALQEAFGLRSTVAVLGFSLRTLADQLAKGQLEALVAEHRAQGGSRPPVLRRGSGEGQPRHEGHGGRGSARIDPFARPSRPAPSVEASAAEPASAEPSAGEPDAESVVEPTASAEPADVVADETELTTSPEA